MSSIKGKNTSPEIAVRKILRKHGLVGYKLHAKNVPGRPDISYPKDRIAIFVHGCYWHRCPKCKPGLPKTHKKFWSEKFKRNVERDKKQAKELRKIGWQVVVVWECDIKKRPDKVLEKIERKLHEQI